MTGASPGLTAADFVEILKADPFADPNYVLTVPPGTGTSTDSRFDLQVGETLPYLPPPTGGQPLTREFSLEYQAISTQGQTATNEHSVGFSAEGKSDFSTFMLDNIKIANTWT